jgi:hypothetical protein
MNKILQRIEREAGVPGLASILARRLSPTDLQSLLLEVYRLRCRGLSPAAVLADYASNRFVRPSPVSPVSLLRWEQIAYAHLARDFHLVELSPVCPLGTISAVGAIDPRWAVTTVRNTEVVSDSTNVLALECSLRRRELLRADPKSREPVHLATSHRLLRAQHFENPEFTSHFSALALCSAGRDEGNLRFELTTLGLHVRFFLTAVREFVGPGVPIQLLLADLSERPRFDLIERELLPSLRSEFPQVECGLEEQRTKGRGYYPDLCFHLNLRAPTGEWLELADGGSLDWTQKYLDNAKERMVASGIGSERLCGVFGGGANNGAGQPPGAAGAR